MQDDSFFRNPPRAVRATLVAGVLAMPGAILGLTLALFVPGRTFLVIAGVVAGAVTGLLVELN